MEKIKVAFFDAKEYEMESFAPYAEEKGLEIVYFKEKLTVETVAFSEGFFAVCAFVGDDLCEEVVKRLFAYGVKLIALRCAGFNHVDLEACLDKLTVLRVPAYSPYAVAEHAMALLLTSNRRIHKAYNRTREYNFSLNGLTGVDLFGKTVGVVGTGKIGRKFIDICRGFGMKVLCYDKFPVWEEGYDYVELDELFERSDVISLHCPLTAETRYLIDERAIEKMKKGVMLVNTSRGALIKGDALLKGIESRKIGSACLDVYEEETDFFSDKSNHIMNDAVLRQLLAMPNVIVTSHQAFLTEEALDAIARTTTDNIRSFFEGNTPTENEVGHLVYLSDADRGQLRPQTE